MAKGSRNGLAKGKKGDSVYYRISGSNNKEQQGERQYVAEINNPKTLAQAAQRVKMTPAVNFYRAFKDEILDHSFQGEKYGARCHAAFMKAALKMNVGFPFVPMGREAVAPGEYLMSRGSIPSLVYDWDDSGNLICEALGVDDPTETLGEWSQGVIDYAPMVQNGDQITIGLVLGNEDGNEFPYVCRIVLDTTNKDDTIGNFFDDLKIHFDMDGVLTTSGLGSYDIEGAVIIISRPNISQTTSAVTWQRSTENMKPNYMLGYMRQRFFSQDAYDAAMYTYMAASRNKLSSEWYLNQGKAAAKANVIPDAPVPTFQFAKLNTTQCHDEDSHLYGKYGAIIVDPTDGKNKLIADLDDSVYNVSSWAQNGQGEGGAAPEPASILYEQQGVSAIPVEWVGQYDDIVSHQNAIAIAAASGVTLTFSPIS